MHIKEFENLCEKNKIRYERINNWYILSQGMPRWFARIENEQVTALTAHKHVFSILTTGKKFPSIFQKHFGIERAEKYGKNFFKHLCEKKIKV